MSALTEPGIAMFDCAAPLEQISAPRYKLPARACDSHCHIFGPAAIFPFAENRPYTPPDAPFEALRALHGKLGIERSVIVQAACHGFDMSAILDAIDRGNGQYRGVALLRPEAASDEIKRLDQGGIRAARFNFIAHLPSPPAEDVERVAALVAPYGWHICIHTDEKSLPAILPLIKRLPVPVVIDHMGRVSAEKGISSDSFKALLDLERTPHAWVKTSGIDRISSTGKRPYSDGRAFVSALMGAMPDRLLWGSDWPHPNVRGDMPDDGELLNIFCELCPDSAIREKILVANPQTLYRFDDPATGD